MATISAVIITKNEAQNIARCIQSLLPVVDEVIVVDSESTDNTYQIAQDLGAQVVTQPFLGYGAQKNFAIGLATCEYILSLDADEFLSLELQAELLGLKDQLTTKAYTVARRNHISRKWVRHAGWYPDRKLRLFPKTAGTWVGQYVHEAVQLSPNTETEGLENDLMHHAYHSHRAMQVQQVRFAELAARSYYEQGRHVTPVAVYAKAVWSFVNTYLIRAGFMDGKLGFFVSKETARYTFLKYKKLREMHTEDSQIVS